MLKKYLIVFLFLSLIVSSSKAQKVVSDSVDKQLLKKIVITEGVVYTAAMVTLSQIWYKDSFQNQFSFFNDNRQWNGVDKVGHAYTTYQLTTFNAQLFQRANIDQKKAYLYSAFMSSTMMLGVEVFDGFSSNYGASLGDILANTLGAFLPLQETIWDEIYIHPKYSFHPTRYASIRPSVLGNGIAEEWLKDYNGQTYWISTNLNLFSKNDSFPDWLVFSIGYGADGMVYGNNEENSINGYQSSKQVYLSLDLDFSKFKTNNKWLKKVFYGLNLLKIPFPTIGITQNRVNFYPFYF